VFLTSPIAAGIFAVTAALLLLPWLARRFRRKSA
jgi:hypothetical protein